MIFGYSRMRYTEFTTDNSTRNVIHMHFNTSRYFAEYTDTILYDDMMQVVMDRKLKVLDSTFNDEFLNFS